jgi:hypothetical protein
VPPMGDQVLQEFAQVLSGEGDLASDQAPNVGPPNGHPPNGRQRDEQPTKEGSEA